LNSRPLTFFGLLFIAACEESMIANFVSGTALATFSVAPPSGSRRRSTRSYFWRASDVRFGT
jgi:hypothetical protein